MDTCIDERRRPARSGMTFDATEVVGGAATGAAVEAGEARLS